MVPDALTGYYGWDAAARAARFAALVSSLLGHEMSRVVPSRDVAPAVSAVLARGVRSPLGYPASEGPFPVRPLVVSTSLTCYSFSSYMINLRRRRPYAPFRRARRCTRA